MATLTTYAVANYFTPVFNTQTTPFKLPLNRKKEDGRIMAMETVAFPGTLFTVKIQLGTVWEIATREYPSATPIYVDSRLISTVEDPKERVRVLPSAEVVIKMLDSLVGTRYFWGGNCPEGVSQLLDLYEDRDKIAKEDREDATCSGVDCSGLLYYATSGCTPRNTSQLINFGEEVDINNLSAEEICDKAKPLDLIVWRGHVLIALPSKKVIESRIGYGVVVSPFVQRLEEVQTLLKTDNKPYYVRRWHPDMLA